MQKLTKEQKPRRELTELWLHKKEKLKSDLMFFHRRSLECEQVSEYKCARASSGADITTTVDFSTIQVPACDIHVTVNDGDTTVGSKGETLLSSPNIDASDPENETLRYTLDCNGYNTTYFEMDESTGDVYFGGDFDPGGLTDTAFLTINIADTNDFTPIFERDYYNVFLFPTEDIGTILINVSASV
ncbi:Hypothetical predicted protein [Mytilus galloprovincialis]|uniref:Cadherin domain-containing protein n=1 Tax=Mytilus galloprovincialis TaxID=29158 RepID=A0A8B6FS07_MYTGA|nr:Hypothetical predicted protein [Mytilus galloprovincialis]